MGYVPAFSCARVGLIILYKVTLLNAAMGGTSAGVIKNACGLAGAVDIVRVDTGAGKMSGREIASMTTRKIPAIIDRSNGGEEVIDKS